MTTRTPAEIEAGARGLYESKPEHKRMDFRSHVWTWGDVVAKMPDIADDYRCRVMACLAAADAAAAPAVGVSDRGETAIEAARELLLMLHLEVMTGASLVSPAVTALMTELDNAIFAWDAEQMEPGMGEEQG